MAEKGIDPEACAARLEKGLEPSEYTWRKQRLQILWTQKPKANGMDEAKASAWLAETARLLEPYPRDILAAAIDECASACKFLPDVAEIIAIADPVLRKRRLCMARLREAVRPDEPVQIEKPRGKTDAQTLAAILEEEWPSWREHGSGDRSPAKPVASNLRHPTRDDYLEMGVAEADLPPSLRNERKAA